MDFLKVAPDPNQLPTPGLDDGESDEQKCTQKIGILAGLTKKWRIKRIDELNDDELDKFNIYSTSESVMNDEAQTCLKNVFVQKLSSLSSVTTKKCNHCSAHIARNVVGFFPTEPIEGCKDKSLISLRSC